MFATSARPHLAAETATLRFLRQETNNGCQRRFIILRPRRRHRHLFGVVLVGRGIFFPVRGRGAEGVLVCGVEAGGGGGDPWSMVPPRRFHMRNDRPPAEKQHHFRAKSHTTVGINNVNQHGTRPPPAPRMLQGSWPKCSPPQRQRRWSYCSAKVLYMIRPGQAGADTAQLAAPVRRMPPPATVFFAQKPSLCIRQRKGRAP